MKCKLPMNRLVIYLCFIYTSALAQVKPKESFTVYINHPEGTVKANVLSLPTKNIINKSLTYSWYASNKIIETQGGFEGKLLDGLFTSFYLSNNLKEKGMYRKGLKDGEWMTWYEDGKIKAIKSWKQGLKSGSWKEFNSKGELLTEATYKKDLLNGSVKLFENEKLVSLKNYKNGQEIPPPVKQETNSSSEKKSFKKKWKSIFRKKEKIAESDGGSAHPAS